MNKLLIANRGEIALRILRTARKMGIRTVCIYSELDADSLHVSQADEAYCIGQSELADTYLNIEKIIKIGVETRCQAIHPGYGFLAENPAFVIACKRAGMLFVGPDERAMHVMGNKIEARAFAESAGVQVTKGLTGDKDYLLQQVDSIGFPVLVKAAAGGGGKGMRIVRTKAELSEALESTSREAANYFSDGTVYIEKFVENPRHIEIQLLGDSHGNVVHLFERECSIQRRYQKIIEEAPSPTLNQEVRMKMGEAAVKLGKAIGYSGAGTIEFLVDSSLNYYFLEMNTRIQVEHPVTEMTTGIDIVEEQLRVASGEQLRFVQDDLVQRGHAIECRIYAEDPENQFMPSPGETQLYHEPAGEFIRVDSAIEGKPIIRSNYDPMISKLIVWGEDREQARQRMMQALNQYIVHGIKSNISYLLAVLNQDSFIQNRITTKYCDEYSNELLSAIESGRQAIDISLLLISGLVGSLHFNRERNGNAWEQIGYWRQYMRPQFRIADKNYSMVLESYTNNQIVASINGSNCIAGYHLHEKGKLELNIEGNHYLCWISADEPGRILVSHSGFSFEVHRLDILPVQQEFSNSESSSSGENGDILSPMPGRVIKIDVAEGQAVVKGDLLLVVEAMKMENRILCPRDGEVERINVAVGDLVDGSTRLVHLKDAE
ncbi:MAG: acetyl-CoA carboxylase biotin carboxylase subunit [Bacteroidales bacterium]|nr:acetyl-CoA carboxylase biotin carboxylase subunit [Bacteroidales bacterium]